MTDDERKAMVWLDGTISDPNAYNYAKDAARTLKAMLSRPVMPEETDEGVIKAMIAGFRQTLDPSEVRAMLDVYRALYAHLTKPKTKTGYRVLWTAGSDSGEYGPYDGVDEAARQAQTLLRQNSNRVISIVVTITPHEVAA